MATITAPTSPTDMAVFNATAALELKLMESLKIHIAQAVRKMTEGWPPEAISTVLSGKEAPERVYEAIDQFGLRVPAPGTVYECIFFSFMLHEEKQPKRKTTRLIIENVKLGAVLRRSISGPSRKMV